MYAEQPVETVRAYQVEVERLTLVIAKECAQLQLAGYEPEVIWKGLQVTIRPKVGVGRLRWLAVARASIN